MKVLVTGAGGYVGGRLIPRLLADGHQVRATFSSARRDRSPFWWLDAVEDVTMDVRDPEQVAAAVEGIDAVYYLIHAMAGDDFVETDRQSARTMADAAAAAGVDRIVYLSGLVPEAEELSDHLASRHEVEQLLAGSGVSTITLRAGIVIGAGSTSFELVRQLSERLPVQTVPDWMESRVQPIAVVDVIEALVGALAVEGDSRSYDVGGPDVVGYPELLRIYAHIAGLTRPQLPLPFVPAHLVGFVAGLITDVPGSVVESLVESLHHDMVCREDDFITDLLPADHRLLTVEGAIVRALAVPPPGAEPEYRDPMGPMPQDPHWAGGQGGGVASWAAAYASVLRKTPGAVLRRLR